MIQSTCSMAFGLAVEEVVHHHDVPTAACRSRREPLSPVVIRTRAIRASLKTMPKKDRLASPRRGRDDADEEQGAAICRNTRCGCWPGGCRSPPQRSASVRPVHVREDCAEAMVVAGDGALAARHGRNSPRSCCCRSRLKKPQRGLNVWKIVRSRCRFPNVDSRPSRVACTKPVPGVVKLAQSLWEERGEEGVGTVWVTVEPRPSQLISRRPPESSRPGLLPLLTAPSADAVLVDRGLYRRGGRARTPGRRWAGQRNLEMSSCACTVPRNQRRRQQWECANNMDERRTKVAVSLVLCLSCSPRERIQPSTKEGTSPCGASSMREVRRASGTG